MNTHTACDCYECVGPEYAYGEHGRYLKNNLKKHTMLEPCDGCGRPKTEYRDLGTKGYYVCWWCNYRTADSDVVETKSGG